MNTKAEQVFNELVEKFKKEAMSAVNESIATIHGDLLPYINVDTETNARYRAVDMVSKILVGDFEFDDNYVKVDGWIICRINDFNYNKIVDVLAAKAGDAAKDAKIARLEAQIKDMYAGRIDMHIKIEWMGVDCIADYWVEDGVAIVDGILIGKQHIYMFEASNAVSDEIHALVDAARRGYVDDTMYFGEEI